MRFRSFLKDGINMTKKMRVYPIGKKLTLKGKTYEEFYGKEKAEKKKRKMVETRMRNGSYVAWNKGLSKEMQPCYGRPQSEKSKRMASLVHKGKIVSKETRKKQSESHKGKTPWNKGIKGYSTSINGKTYRQEIIIFV